LLAGGGLRRLIRFLLQTSNQAWQCAPCRCCTQSTRSGNAACFGRGFRLHEKGFIDNPVSKTKSVVFTEEGLEESKRLFEAMFTKE
jgi:hypothetical protein